MNVNVHFVLDQSSDGRMLLWDPVASNTPVASVLVGPAVNSACFSAGDPYALLCAPQLGKGGGGAVGSGSKGGGSGGGNDCDDLVQIWDLRCGVLCSAPVAKIRFVLGVI